MQPWTNKGSSGVNDPTDKDDSTSPSVLDVLKLKHPTAKPAQADALISNGQAPPEIHPVIF